MKDAITLTEKAAEHVKELLDAAPEAAEGLRVSIVSAGCSGHKYQFDYAKSGSVSEADTLVEQNGVKIYIDRSALMYLLGSVMDFSDDGFKSGFVFDNPNVSSACGCGESVQFTRDEMATDDRRV
ncbi:MAG: iron-sulfur cluster assembly accessory protein [Pseudomonadota bacterium]|nr:iron-sulfur cluster assembly accessory protein [Pseudomonadota bacterium]QKK06101.1 MAG: iron-sulfur cluster assembly accessory protein [Pseudomonadota bacterium]